MPDRLVLLGTKGGPSIRKGSPSPSASLLQLGGKNILIDCGLGVTRSCVEAGVVLKDIDAIFITHLHSDHLLELGPFLYTAWTTNLTTNIDVYGPPGIEAYWLNFLKSMSFDYAIRTSDEKRNGLKELVTVHSYGEGPVAEVGQSRVSALRVDHPPVTDCFALRFDTPGSVVVFSADTCFFPPLADFAKDADILVHEAMLEAGVDALVKRNPGAPNLRAHLMASHTCAQDVGRIAAEAGVGRLVLNHLVPSDDPAFGPQDWQAAIASTWDGPLIVGEDGLDITI